MFSRSLSKTEIENMYNTHPRSQNYTTITTTDQIDTSLWGAIDVTLSTEDVNGANSFYAVSFDGRNEFKVWTGSAWRTVASNQNSTTGLTEGKWGFVNAGTGWTLAETV